MAKKKDFTSADSAIDKFFTPPKSNATAINADIANEPTGLGTGNANITKDTYINNISHNTNISKVAHKSKHYDDRGKRDERFGLLLDKQLKEDLVHLSKVSGSKSVNDLIVTILLDYVNQEDNRVKLKQYREILQS